VSEPTSAQPPAVLRTASQLPEWLGGQRVDTGLVGWKMQRGTAFACERDTRSAELQMWAK
jgi:hypothetical protein